MEFFADEKILSLRRLVDAAEKVVLVSHLRPDGDALGSLSSAASYLASVCGKDVTVLVADDVPEGLSFILDEIPCSPDCSVLGRCDLVVALDINCLDRAGRFEQALRECKAPKVLIDHHPNPVNEEFNLVFSCTEVSSACELQYWILKSLENGCVDSIPMKSLTALMCGMTTDTNNFANSVWPSTLQMASELLAAGVDRDELIGRIFNSYRENRVRAISYFLNRKLVIRGSFAYIVVSAADRCEFDLRDGELEGMVNIPLSIADVKMSATFTEDDGYFRVSIRSKKGVSSNAFARQFFHGGGHEQASGGRIYFPEDLPDPEAIDAYVCGLAARFLQENPS